MNLFKKKPKKVFKYDFEADNGQFSCTFEIRTTRSKLFDFYNEHFRSKLARVLNPDEVFKDGQNWELGGREKMLCAGKLRKKLLEEALKEVRVDLPRFKPHHDTLETVRFSNVGEDAYLITIKFSGLCEGDE